MGLYIPNLQMPVKGNISIDIYATGLVVSRYTGNVLPDHAVQIPPHGRLIDTEAKVKTQLYDDEHKEWSDEVELTVEQYLGYCFNEVPTIIPADPAEEG